MSLYEPLLVELESLDAADWMALQAFILKTGAIVRTFDPDRVDGLPKDQALSSLSESEARDIKAQLKSLLEGLLEE